MSDKTGAKGFYDPDVPGILGPPRAVGDHRDELRRNAARVVEIRPRSES